MSDNNKMKTAEEFFESKNGGKPASDMVRDNEYITATWAVILMRDYAQEVTASDKARIEELEKTIRRMQKLPDPSVADYELCKEANNEYRKDILRLEEVAGGWATKAREADARIEALEKENQELKAIVRGEYLANGPKITALRSLLERAKVWLENNPQEEVMPDFGRRSLLTEIDQLNK